MTRKALVLLGMLAWALGCGGGGSSAEDAGGIALADLDGDGDGVLSSEEWPQDGAGFAEVDVDGDGIITRVELDDFQASGDAATGESGARSMGDESGGSWDFHEQWEGKCMGIELCLSGEECGEDADCIQGCLDQFPSSAQAKHTALMACFESICGPKPASGSESSAEWAECAEGTYEGNLSSPGPCHDQMQDCLLGDISLFG